MFLYLYYGEVWFADYPQTTMHIAQTNVVVLYTAVLPLITAYYQRLYCNHREQLKTLFKVTLLSCFVITMHGWLMNSDRNNPAFLVMKITTTSIEKSCSMNLFEVEYNGSALLCP